jgi:hypothetical protein
MAKFNSNAYKPSAEDMRAYKDPKGYLFVTETVWYQDVFGTPHWSTVCRWHRYNTAFNDFGFCGWGNAVDRNDP